MDEKTTVAICDNTACSVAPSIAVFPNEITATTGPMEISDRPSNKTSGLGFGTAIQLMKEGKQLQRAGWNGKNQYIELATNISYTNAKGEVVNVNHDDIGSQAIAFVGTSGVQLGWLASQADMLATDWRIVIE